MSEKDNSSIIKEYNKELADLDNVEIAGFKGDMQTWWNLIKRMKGEIAIFLRVCLDCLLIVF